jgi:hypothetical protein
MWKDAKDVVEEEAKMETTAQHSVHHAIAIADARVST